MHDLESVFRWAFWYDFKTTPEQAFPRLFGEAGRSTSITKMSLEAMLFEFEDHIRKAGVDNNIDARAVAGAIAWEYEENYWFGRVSDRVPLFNQVSWLNNGVGWGSMHHDVAQELRPGASDEELWRLRMQADSAINLVAEHMSNLATLYFELTLVVKPPLLPSGIWIRDVPEALANFYQGSEKSLRSSAMKRRDSEERETGTVTLSIQDDMGVWVRENIARFDRFKTQPLIPTGHTLVRVRTVN